MFPEPKLSPDRSQTALCSAALEDDLQLQHASDEFILLQTFRSTTTGCKYNYHCHIFRFLGTDSQAFNGKFYVEERGPVSVLMLDLLE